MGRSGGLADADRGGDNMGNFFEPAPIGNVSRLRLAVSLRLLHRLAPHVLDDAAYAVARNAGMFEEDVVRAAEDVIRMERIREMLLD